MLTSEFQGYYLNDVVVIFSSDPRAHFLKLKNDFSDAATIMLYIYEGVGDIVFTHFLIDSLGKTRLNRACLIPHFLHKCLLNDQDRYHCFRKLPGASFEPLPKPIFLTLAKPFMN